MSHFSTFSPSSLTFTGICSQLKVISESQESTSVRPELEAAGGGALCGHCGQCDPTRLGLASESLLPHSTHCHWFLSDIRPRHTPASSAEHLISVCKLQKFPPRDTAIKQVLTSLSLHRMMQSDNNLPARLRVKF